MVSKGGRNSFFPNQRFSKLRQNTIQDTSQEGGEENIFSNYPLIGKSLHEEEENFQAGRGTANARLICQKKEDRERAA